MFNGEIVGLTLGTDPTHNQPVRELTRVNPDTGVETFIASLGALYVDLEVSGGGSYLFVCVCCSCACVCVCVCVSMY